MLTFILTILISVFPACPSEDSSMCYWDSAAHGNGQGNSFIALSEDVTITFKP